MIKFDPEGGAVSDSIRIAIQMAALAKETVEFTFNGTTVEVSPDYETQVYRAWSEKRSAGNG